LVRTQSLKRVLQWVDPLEPCYPIQQGVQVDIETLEKHEWHHQDRCYHCSDGEVGEQAADEVSQRNSGHDKAPQAEEEHEEAFHSPVESHSEVNDDSEDQWRDSEKRHFSKCLCIEVGEDIVHCAALFPQEYSTFHLKKADCTHEGEHELIRRYES